MCFLNYPPYDSEGPEEPLPRGVPRLAWAVPVDMGKLGATLQAVRDTMSEVTTLRLCHRFRDCTLSRLPQEILDQIIDSVRRVARAKLRPGWKQDFICFQGMCLPEEHYHMYNETTEKMWQKIFIQDNQIRHYKPAKDPKNYSDDEKLEMLHDEVMSNWQLHEEEDGWALHVDAGFRWLERTCMCKERPPNHDPGDFVHLNNMLRSHFGLEVIILHEILSPTMHDFLPNLHVVHNQTYFTAAYLTLASRSVKAAISEHGGLFFDPEDHSAFQQVIEPSQLSLTEEQRQRFARAMKRLDVKPRCQLRDLEPHVIHPIEDEWLVDLCSCHAADCPACDIKSWDKPFNIKEVLHAKSKELAKESWPKLMLIAASDAVSPSSF